MEEERLEELIAEAKDLQASLLALATVTTSEAEQQCSRPVYAHPFTDMLAPALCAVFQYLHWRDCASAAQVCFVFKTVIASRPFQVMVYRSTKQVAGMLEGAPEAPQETETKLADYSQLTKDQALLNTKKTIAVISYLGEKFASQKRRNEQIESQLGKAKDELRIQIQLRNKTAARVRQLEEQPLYENALSLAAALERDSASMELQVSSLQGELRRCEGKRKELQLHKRLLVTEVKRLRQKTEEDRAAAEDYVRTLERIQHYFTEMHSPRIEAMAPDVHCL